MCTSRASLDTEILFPSARNTNPPELIASMFIFWGWQKKGKFEPENGSLLSNWFIQK